MNNRSFLFSIFLPIILSGFFSCAKKTLDAADEYPPEVEFLVLTDQNKQEQTVLPRLAFSCGDWTGMEIVDNTSESEKVVFQFINRKERANTLVICSANSVCFVENDPRKSLISSDAVICTLTGGLLEVTNASYDWDEGTYTVGSINRYELSAENSDRLSAKGANLPDDERKSLYNMLDRLGTTISVGEYIPAPAQGICSVWSHLAIPIAKYELYNMDPDLQNTVRDEIALDEGKSQLVTLLGVDKVVTFYSMVKGLFDFKKLKDVYEEYWNSEDDAEYDNTVRTLSSFPSWTENMRRMIILEGKQPGRLDFTMSYTIEENTAVIHADFSAIGSVGYISDCGLSYGIEGKTPISKAVDSFPTSLVIENLVAGKKYFVTAFASSFGIKYSKTISFSIIPTFSVNPTSLLFGPSGGSQGVSVTFPTGWKWRVSKRPTWCVVEEGELSFFVDVKSYSGDRNGIIEVMVSSQDQEPQTIEIQVVQKNLWDGTVWKMKFELTNFKYSANEHLQWLSEATSYESLLSIEDVSQGKYVDSPGFVMGKMSVKSDKELSFNDSWSESISVDLGDGETASSTIKRDYSLLITMLDTSTVQVKGHVSAVVSGYSAGSASADISGSGSLVSQTKSVGEQSTSGPILFFRPSFHTDTEK